MTQSKTGEQPQGRILVVDDQPHTATVIRAWYRGKPFEVLDASNGEEGLRLAAKHSPHVILLDLRMPGMDGMAVAKKLKANPDTRGIPILLLTAERNTGRKVEAFDAGAIDYITKPFEMEEVEARVRTAMQRAGELLRWKTRARHDGLTGLLSFLEFQKRLSEEWQRAERYKTPLSLVFLDLDHFKRINDSMGHQAGDQALREFAMLVAGGARANDLTARYGGEEFAIILPHTDADESLRVAERIVAAVRDFSFLADLKKTKLTVSAGVATLNAEKLVRSRDDLVRAADSALYRAKDTGRNCVHQHRAGNSVTP